MPEPGQSILAEHAARGARPAGPCPDRLRRVSLRYPGLRFVGLRFVGLRFVGLSGLARCGTHRHALRQGGMIHALVPKRKPRPERARTQARRVERAREQLGRDQERLFSLSPGGSAARPLRAGSASVLETRALQTRCPLCEGEHELLEHAAVTEAGVRLRKLDLRCRRCGSRRSLYFQLEEGLLN